MLLAHAVLFAEAKSFMAALSDIALTFSATATALSALPGLSGCGDSDSPAPPRGSERRAGDRTGARERVANRWQASMVFAVVGPARFLGSGNRATSARTYRPA